jgi:cation transport regulator ChaB
MTDMIPRAEADARVAAAFEEAASAVWEEYQDSLANKWTFRKEHVEDAIIRALTPDDARAALNAMLAEAEKRGEKRGMLRAAEIAWARVEGNSGRDREAAEISMSIRAEAEE